MNRERPRHHVVDIRPATSEEMKETPWVPRKSAGRGHKFSTLIGGLVRTIMDSPGAVVTLEGGNIRAMTDESRYLTQVARKEVLLQEGADIRTFVEPHPAEGRVVVKMQRLPKQDLKPGG